MATLATLRNAVSRKTGLDNTNSSAEQGLMDEWANQAITEILVRTHCTVECANFETIANTWKYELPTSILSILEIWNETASEPLVRVDYDTLLAYHESSSQASSYARYSTLGSNLMLLWPTPTAAYTLNIFYVPRPSVMSASANSPADEAYGRIPTEFHKAIEYYMLWQAADYDDDKSSQYGLTYQALFEDYLKKTILPAIHRKGGTRLPKAKVKVRQPVARDNSTYP